MLSERYKHRKIKLSKEGQRRLRILTNGTKEERDTLQKQSQQEQARREHAIIARYAYFLWEVAGCPSGRDLEFWFAAEAQWQQECDDYEPCIAGGVAY